MAIETVKERRTRLQAELDILNKIEKPTSKQTRKATSLIKQITALDAKIFKGRERKRQLEGTLSKVQKATAAKVVEAAGPARPPIKITVDDTTKYGGARGKSKAAKKAEASIEPAPPLPPSQTRKTAPIIESGVAEEKRKRVRKGFAELEKGAEAGRRKSAREKTAKTEREGFGELEKGAEAGRRRFELREKKYKSPKDYQIVYDSPNRPGKDAIGVSSKDPALTKTKVNKAVKTALKQAEKDTPGRFGTAAGKKAIKGFFRDVLGIKDISVEYDDPAKFGQDVSSSTGEDISGYGGGEGKKKGGKVTAKRPTAKKYAMSRGSKVASVRKPTRA